MPPIKPIATHHINIPRIPTPVSYQGWLHRLLDVVHNRKVLSRLGKEDVDQCLCLQATKQFELDNNKLKKALTEIQQGSSKTVWDEELRYRRIEPAEDLQELSLPQIDIDGNTEMRDLWKVLTYQKFAENLERKNPNTVLTKQIVDSAFRLVLGRIGKKKGWAGRENAVARASYSGYSTVRQPC